MRLLHYRPRLLGGYASEVDSPEFFLSPEGRTDPERELAETVRILADPAEAPKPRGISGYAAACAFPARRAFLERALGRALPPPEGGAGCADLREWKAGIQARSASVVFSSVYPNNPASMFGHTLLRLNRQTLAERNVDRRAGALGIRADLLSYGVNFSAQVPPDENPFKYALFGLIGKYLGRYDLAPYYRKVNEYALSESRDLWEYDLSLSEEKVDFLVDHLWELYGNGFFAYYFLDENCSYQILTLLEAAEPAWDLSRSFALSVVPAETLKRLTAQPDAVTGITFRPSSKAQMLARVERLTPDERKGLSAILDGDRAAAETDSIATLDAGIAALNYEKQKGGFGKDREAILRSVLLARAGKGSRSTEGSEALASVGGGDPREAPDRSHGTSRVFAAARAGGSDGISASETHLGFSGFEHDFLNDTPSYNSFSEVRVLRFDFARENRANARARLASADLIGMASYADLDPLDPRKSWRVGIAWRDAWTFSGGYGIGKNLLSRRNLVYLLASGVADFGKKTDGALRLAPGIEAGFIFRPFSAPYFAKIDGEILVEATHRSPERARGNAKFAQAYAFSSALDLRLEGKIERAVEGSPRWERSAGIWVDWMY